MTATTIELNPPSADTVPDGANDLPAGWTPEAWAVLCGSAACREANEITDMAEKLHDAIMDFICDHPEDVDREVLVKADVPRPTRNEIHLAYARDNFAGLVWVLEQFISCGDVIPPYRPNGESNGNE